MDNQMPDSWRITREAEDRITIDADGLGFYVARMDSDRIADILLYALAQDLLNATPTTQPTATGAGLRYTNDGALAECPCCGSLDVGGAHHTVHCYRCGLKIEKPGPLQNACDAWNKRALLTTQPTGGESFQDRVAPWMQACFGPEISADKVERNHRFLEESLELVQSLGCTKAEAQQLVDYVYGRPVGDPPQEVGGVRVTLAALCLAAGMDQDECAETELARIWTKVPQIRAKQAAKPKHSPLPEHQPTGGDWVYDSPTDVFGDYRDEVWALDEMGNIELMDIDDARAEWRSNDVCIIAWQATGLTRPQPPQDREGGEA